jgi:hypothetical protein
VEPREYGVPELQGLIGMARKNAIWEARAASQAYAASLRRLTTARALHSPNALELSAAEYMARNHHRRALAKLNT